MRLKMLLSSSCLIVASIAAGFAFPADADTPAKPRVAAGRQPPVPLLWKVSDADSSVYLLGSFHLLKSDDYPLSKDVDAAFDDAKTVVFEVDPVALQDPANEQKYKLAYAYSDGRTLSQVLPKAARGKLEKLLSVGGGSVAQLDHQEPWAVTMALVLGMTQALGFSQEQGLDATLMKRAADQQKPVAGLETVDDQFSSLDAMPMDEQVASLEEVLDNPQASLGELMEMHDWWKRGDLKNLDGKLRADMARKTPVSYQMINVRRNDLWVPRIEQLLAESDQDNTLVVVGTMHLLGADGLVDKLRARGYTVERICSVCKSK